VPRLLALVLAAGALASLAGACAGGNGNGGVAPDDLVRESVEATGAVESFHFAFDSEGVPASRTGLQLLGAEGDAIVPDRVRADVSGTFSGVPLTTQLVAIGEKVWLKDPLEGRWRTVDVGTTPSFLLDPSKGVLDVVRGVEELSDEGSEDVADVKALKVQGTVDAADVAPLFSVSPGAGTAEATLWIGEEDKTLRQLEVVGAVAANEPEDARRIVTLSRMDEPVTIEAPEGAA
jgi:LppX_LprAFG lipoprotein